MWEQLVEHEMRVAYLRSREPLTLRITDQVHARYMEAAAGSRKTSQPSLSMRTPIWLDCDTGHDDAFAILLAARSRDVNLLGISTVYGNAPLENTTFNTRAILKAIGREEVPVYAGASKPLQRETAHAPDIHGAGGLDGTQSLPQPTVPARLEDAVDEMHRALRAEPAGTAWLVAVGALTNVAILLERYPDIVHHLAGLSVMGGAIGGGFSDAPMGTIHGEEAAHVVFSNPALARKTILIPLDLTHQFIATSEVQMGLLFGQTTTGKAERTMANVTPVRRLFFEILTFFAKTYSDVFGLKTGPPTHDPLAVAATFRPDLFVYSKEPKDGQNERFSVEVVTKGEHGASDEARGGNSQCGRTIVQPLSQGESGVTIPRSLDAPALWELLEGCLSTCGNAENAQSPDVK
ncbi:Uridine nucleosidase 1 [Elasticomyces elasticus]|nr:Uridine nucleosidase 1 [Elasticomyces elasticus]